MVVVLSCAEDRCGIAAAICRTKRMEVTPGLQATTRLILAVRLVGQASDGGMLLRSTPDALLWGFADRSGANALLVGQPKPDL